MRARTSRPWVAESDLAVRPYAVTVGRTRPLRALARETMVVAGPHRAGPPPGAEQARTVRLCAHPVAIAELSAQLGVPVQTAKIIVCDLMEDGFLVPAAVEPALPSDPDLLKRVIRGLHAL
ncbi:DUF742 domain-containing protein [Streptomyces jumonjinensis]|uniref:DUF742 domain-containing protein n=1 Tax=Streptomyces jumonjinensis TaxID=1945 RepID=UPI003799329B